MINPELDRLARAKYVSLTTFMRDGTPVASPVRVVSEGGFLQVLTEIGAGMVDRLRRNPEVALAPCDARGDLQGDPVEATAAVIEDPELVARVELLTFRRYGPVVRGAHMLRRWRGKEAYVAVAVEVPPGTPQD